jgi:PRC-barrel domain
MPALFDRLGGPRNRLTALQALGAAVIVAIATAATAVIADPSAPSPTTGAVVEQWPKGQLFRILGEDVHSDTGAAIGRIVDLLVDYNGKPRAAIIDFGGFLGVGTRRVAVDWLALHFWPNDKTAPITVDLDRDQIKAAPEYQPSKEATAVIGLPKVEEGE